MSHYNKVKTKLNNPDFIIAALKEMGLNAHFSEIPMPMRGWRGTQSEAHIVVPGRVNGCGLEYDLGFRRDGDGTYSLVIEDIDASNYRYSHRRRFIDDFQLQYGLVAARQSMPGMVISEMETMADGSIRCAFEVEAQPELAQNFVGI